MAVRPSAAVQSLRCLTYSESRRSLRPCIYFKDKGYSIPSKAICETQIPQRVFSSFKPHKAKVSSDEVSKDEILTNCGTKTSSDEGSKDQILTNCGTDQECAVGGIVALGKFDALHIGHRELAIVASKIGSPFLLSFVGMEEVLGWPYRPPIVAKCDRKRVLSSWASLCGNVAPVEFQVEFSKVRHLTPRQFVEKLSKELRVSGVVAGENYRFGYKASGDAEDLVRLCKEYGLEACIVSHVMDTTRLGYNGAIINGVNFNDKGQVSSTRVRHALAIGDMEYVTQLLGRKHRLVLMVDKEWQCISSQRILAPKSCVLNQLPMNGEFEKCSVLVDDVFVVECRLVINDENLDIELYGGSISDKIQDGQLISIELG